MLNNPKVSIILPCYNSNKERLKLSIDSVLLQSFYNFEFIIIDDASDNKLGNIISQYKDKRIKYIRNDENLMYVKCLIKGIEISKGEYIARIDDDDIREDRDKLKKQIEFLDNNPLYGLVGTDMYCINGNGNIIDKRKIHYSDSDIRSHILGGCPFVHSSVLFRKKCIKTVGTYDLGYTLAEDYELRMRIGKKYKFCNLKDSLVLYRINKSGVSHKYHSKQILMDYKAAFKYLRYYPNSFYYLFKRIIKFPYLYFLDFIKWIKIKLRIEGKHIK